MESQAKIAGDDIDDEDYECSKGERRYHHRQAKLNVIITGTAANNYELNIITLKNADGNLFLRVGDLSLVENDRFTVCENAFVHVVHIHLTHRRSILNDLSRLNVLDVNEPPVFYRLSLLLSTSTSKILYLKAIPLPRRIRGQQSADLVHELRQFLIPSEG